MFSLSCWKNITLDEFYHPKFQYYSRLFMDLTFFISIGVYIILGYIIWRASTKQMGTFKQTIFIQSTFNFLVEVLFFIYSPVFHWPLPVMSFYSHFPIPEKYPFIQASLILFCAIGTIVAFFISLIVRVLSLFEINMTHILNRFKYLIILVCLVVLVIVWASFTVILIFIERDPYLLKQKLAEEVPALTELYQYLPNTFGLHPTFNGELIMVFIYIVVFWIIGAILLFVFLNILFIIRLKKVSGHVSKGTLEMHKMLYKTLLVQLLIIVILVAIPLACLVIGFMFQTTNGSWYANFALPFASLHIIFDAFCVLYFVKPYRRFIVRYFKDTRRMSLGITHFTPPVRF